MAYIERDLLDLGDFVPTASPLFQPDIYGTPCRVGDMVIFASTYGDHGVNLYKGTIKSFSVRGKATIEALLPDASTTTFRLQNNRFIKL